MKVIGLIGLIGSGKDTAAAYLARTHGYKIFSMRDIIADSTRREGLEPNRANMQHVQEKYRKRRGMGYFAELTLRQIVRAGPKRALIKELRKAEDITVPRRRFGSSMIVIRVDAPRMRRYLRLRKRKRLGDPKTFKEFLEQERREHRLFYAQSLRLADYAVANRGTRKELYRALDELVHRLGFG